MVLNVHEIMLCDRPRQKAYRDAIFQNKTHFEGKIVLDVGAGTGILSIFCAQAGAKQVFAVEASNIAKLAQSIIAENNLTGIIQVFQQHIEDFNLPAGIESVDIIISEWMGFYLLHEGMLDSVIYARDTFLKHDGLMYPQNATINISPCSVPGRFADWKSVDGVKLTKFGEAIRKQKSENPEIRIAKPEHLLTDGTVIAWLDLRDVTVTDLDEFQFKEVIVAQRAGQCQGLCIWFDCEFPTSNEDNESIVLSTSPFTAPTHWKQTIIVFPDSSIDEQIDAKYPIAFSLKIARNPIIARQYNLEVAILGPDEIEHPIPCDCIMTKCILANAYLKQLTADSMQTE